MPWAYAPFGAGRWVWGLFTVGFIYCLASAAARERLDRIFSPLAEGRLWLWGLLLGNLVLFWLEAYRFRDFGYRGPWPHLFLGLLATPWIRRDRLWVSCLLNLGFLAASIFTFPLHEQRSNMLPLIQEGLNQWRNGQSPYGPLVMSYATDRMPFLPGTLFSQLPAWSLGLDPRWNTLLFRAVWMGLLLRQLGKREVHPAWVNVLHFFVLSPFLNFRHELYFEFFLLLMALYWVFPRLRWLTLPLMVVTRQWAWVLAPFAVADLMRGRRPLKAALELTTGAVAVGLGMWLLLRSTTNWALLLDGLTAHPPVTSESVFFGDYGLTLVPSLTALGLGALLQSLQAVLSLACLIYGMPAPRADLRRAAVGGLIGFILLNFHFWNYLWTSAIFWMIAYGLAVSSVRGPRLAPSERVP